MSAPRLTRRCRELVREMLGPITPARARAIAASLNGTIGLGVQVQVSPEGRVQVDIPRLGLSTRQQGHRAAPQGLTPPRPRYHEPSPYRDRHPTPCAGDENERYRG